MTYSSHLRLFACLAISLCLVRPACGGKYDPRGAYISLHAKFNSTPLVHEAAEFLHDEEPSLLWDFVDLWHQVDSSNEDCWSAIAKTAAKLITPNLAKVLQLVVGVRQYAAKLEMFAQVAAQSPAHQEHCCWAEVEGQVFTDAASLRTAVTAELQRADRRTAEDLPPFDHVYPGLSAHAVDTKHAVVVVVYGGLGSSCFKQLHQTAAALVKEAQEAAHGMSVVYVWRPHAPSLCRHIDATAAAQCGLFGAHEQLELPAFGAEFVIKNMEYKTMDEKQAGDDDSASKGPAIPEGPDDVKGFRFDILLKRKPDAQKELLAFRDHLLESALEEDTLKVWDVKELGIKASQLILQASDPLFVLTELSQSFPSRTRSLSQSPVNSTVNEVLAANQQMLPGGRNLMVLNGVMMDMDGIDLYGLLDRIRSEVRLSDNLLETGLPNADIMSLMLLRSQLSGDQSGEFAVALSDNELICWLNDLEQDSIYSKWDTNLQSLFYRLMPGQMHRLARNLYNGIVVADLGNVEGLLWVSEAMSVVSDKWPLRLGVLPVCSGQSPEHSTGQWESLSTCQKLIRMWFTTYDNLDGRAAGSMIMEVVKSPEVPAEPTPGSDLVMSDTTLKEAFMSRWGRHRSSDDPAEGEAWNQVLAGSGVAKNADKRAQEVHVYVEETGCSPREKDGVQYFLNGLPQGSHGERKASIILPAMYELQFLQENIYMGRISGKGDIYEEVLTHRNALPRTNPQIFDDQSDRVRQVRLIGEVLSPSRNPVVAELGYLHPPGTEDNIKPVTMWLVVDLSSPQGRKALQEGLRYLVEGRENEGSRLAVVLNPVDPVAPMPLLPRIVLAASNAPSRRAKVPGFLLELVRQAPHFGDDLQLLPAALKIAEESGLQDRWLQDTLQSMHDGPASSSSIKELASKHMAIARALGLRAGAAAVATNGRVLTLYQPGDAAALPLVATDFSLMAAKASIAQYSGSIESLLEDAALEERAVVVGADGEVELMAVEELSDAGMVASSVLTADKAQVDDLNVRLMRALPNFQTEAASVELTLEHGLPLQFTLFLDPLCRTAQRLSPLLSFVRDALGVSVHLFMNPIRELSDMPLKTFYRYSLPQVEVQDDLIIFLGAPVAYFNSLPPTKVLTLHMDVPSAWLVEASKAEYDLDNFKPQDLGDEPNMYAEFELEAILLVGACSDVAPATRQDSHPRGVQLALGPPEKEPLVDTLVMANLGYFQLKASPGLWSLQLAPGRSPEIYEIVGSDGLGSEIQTEAALQLQHGASDTQVPVVIDSFQGKQMNLRLRKRAGKEQEDVLKDVGTGGTPGHVWSKVSSLWKKDSSGHGKAPKDTLNIFTVASGHMYERLQKIMVLSVIKNTKMHVKVWFIKNYMSPQMKAFVPHMAAKYGFDYEFVTYKWPEWLHKQTDKQRIIWAYKILFLDVLFPLNVNKVIFVDSDQIIRGDMQELYDMDLKVCHKGNMAGYGGAPYGYTPFCDNNKEMDGFRFWKQGFWQGHLRGKPYHISALYVVDLAKFRHLAAGDNLRVIYDGLSRDPNSLANLDQDLPNYAQHQVPIFSLPQEWLWCETWCGNATKAAAKTIDLCNNPLTKEPKLQSARRIVKEWSGLDDEAQAFTAQVMGSAAPAAGPTAEGSCSTDGGEGEQCSADGSSGHDATEL